MRRPTAPPRLAARVCAALFVGAAASGAKDGRLRAPKFPFEGGRGWSVFLSENGDVRMLPGTEHEGSVAWGSFTDAIDTTGWSVLDIHTSEEFSGDAQSYAAGFLEGALTSERMAQHQRNMWGVDFHDKPVGRIPPKAAEFSSNNLKWMRTQVSENGHRDPYWRMVGFLLEQLRGLAHGYNYARRRERLSEAAKVEVLMSSVVDTDMDDLMTAVVMNGEFVNSHYRDHRRHRGHCSALVQAAPGNKDLFTGHVTWDEYRGMLRVVKYLDMPLPGAVSRSIRFTSNPGALYSGDDWYVTDQGITALETSIENYNRSLWTQVQPESVLTWVRAMVANRLAVTGDDWTKLQLRHQSGTCNNQWMVVDYKRFTPGEALKEGTLWVAETMPGHAHRADMTQTLIEKGSWPSYNIPYFKEIWTVGGYKTMMDEANTTLTADQYSWERDVRARMFERARENKDVHDLHSFSKFLRYNDPHDPLAHGSACNGISARCDLVPVSEPDYDCFGGIDAKVMGASSDWRDLSFFAVSSPTFSEEERPFDWRDQDSHVDGCRREQHVGHPDKWDFGWYWMPSRVPPPRFAEDSLEATGEEADSLPGPWPAVFAGAALAAVGAAVAAVGGCLSISERRAFTLQSAAGEEDEAGQVGDRYILIDA